MLLDDPTIPGLLPVRRPPSAMELQALSARPSSALVANPMRETVAVDLDYAGNVDKTGIVVLKQRRWWVANEDGIPVKRRLIVRSFKK
ncbi:hypothetical protein DIPPA_04836 [Diplonema papillatum]|nr:hypothetical protein DIPPA_04836 [Diplonema papillatum]